MADYKLKNRDNGPRLIAKTWLIRLAAVTTLLLPLLSVQARDRMWIGGRAGHLTDWNDNNNWDDGTGGSGKPGNGDNAVFAGTFTFQPQLTGNTSCGAIWVQAGLGQD